MDGQGGCDVTHTSARSRIGTGHTRPSVCRGGDAPVPLHGLADGVVEHTIIETPAEDRVMIDEQADLLRTLRVITWKKQQVMMLKAADTAMQILSEAARTIMDKLHRAFVQAGLMPLIPEPITENQRRRIAWAARRQRRMGKVA